MLLQATSIRAQSLTVAEETNEPMPRAMGIRALRSLAEGDSARSIEIFRWLRFRHQRYYRQTKPHDDRIVPKTKVSSTGSHEEVCPIETASAPVGDFPFALPAPMSML